MNFVNIQIDDHQDARRILLDEYTNECDKQRDEKLKDIAESLTRPRYRCNNQSCSSGAILNSAYQTKPTRDGECSEEEQKKNYDRMDSPPIASADHIDGSADKLVGINFVIYSITKGKTVTLHKKGNKESVLLGEM